MGNATNRKRGRKKKVLPSHGGGYPKGNVIEKGEQPKKKKEKRASGVADPILKYHELQEKGKKALEEGGSITSTWVAKYMFGNNLLTGRGKKKKKKKEGRTP